MSKTSLVEQLSKQPKEITSLIMSYLNVRDVNSLKSTCLGLAEPILFCNIYANLLSPKKYCAPMKASIQCELRWAYYYAIDALHFPEYTVVGADGTRFYGSSYSSLQNGAIGFIAAGFCFANANVAISKKLFFDSLYCIGFFVGSIKDIARKCKTKKNQRIKVDLSKASFGKAGRCS